jgi:hypothetical protein
MCKEMVFLIYCLERYRYFKGLSGQEAVDLFQRYDLINYITTYFEALHTMSDAAIMQDLDEQIAAENAYISNGTGSGSTDNYETIP